MSTLARSVSMNLRCCFAELKLRIALNARVIGLLSSLAYRQRIVSSRFQLVLLNCLPQAVGYRNAELVDVQAVENSVAKKRKTAWHNKVVSRRRTNRSQRKVRYWGL